MIMEEAFHRLTEDDIGFDLRLWIVKTPSPNVIYVNYVEPHDYDEYFFGAFMDSVNDFDVYDREAVIRLVEDNTSNGWSEGGYNLMTLYDKFPQTKRIMDMTERRA